ncbi:MAG TPA: protein TolQ [Rhodospirillaceae bacterium]|nr:MAG: protein TolQ [Alphaproteobacteria bacterium GWF2_58_20]HAU29057.1 protein TolQ [Rhodospirillaceae bacterium]
MNPEVAVQTIGGGDFSILDLFMISNTLVQLVMIGLVIASIWSWAVIFEKYQLMRKLKASADSFEDSFWSGGSLEALYAKVGKKPDDPMAATFAAGMREWKLSTEKSAGAVRSNDTRVSLHQRIERVMGLTIGRELARCERYMIFLASVGSTAPFLGLFGTVWGIMNSFSAIAGSQNTSIATVAPGIAESLLSTAIGLVAAIPAVLAYNKFSTDITRYADRLEGFATEFGAILSRHLEEKE